ncbi:MAG: hypothetical protein IB618_00070 [Candidatus Pacearchaeota archaeon]|nr:MAG: hypothetical protein IB618_00070 [Candidatus Pacearchaeota archaeon]
MKIIAKLDIQKIQYMNVFEKVVGLKAKYCFNYDSIIIFAVPRKLVTKAIGRNAENVNRLMRRINRKVKIVAVPTSRADLEYFIKVLIFPHKFRKLLLQNNELIIFSALREKAALIGRGKRRLHELSDILEKFFSIKKVIIK